MKELSILTKELQNKGFGNEIINSTFEEMYKEGFVSLETLDLCDRPYASR